MVLCVLFSEPTLIFLISLHCIFTIQGASAVSLPVAFSGSSPPR